MSYKIIEKNGVKHKVWSSVEEDFLSHVGGGSGANLFEEINVPKTLKFGILDAVTTTDPQTATPVIEFDGSKNVSTLPEFIDNRLVLCFNLKKHIPFELHEKIEKIKKCIVTRESNFETDGHRNAYSNLTTSSMLNLQQDMQFFVQEDYNKSVRLYEKLAVAGDAANYAIAGEFFGGTGSNPPPYMINKTYVENGNTMTGYIILQMADGLGGYSAEFDAFFGLPRCVLEAIYLKDGYVVFHLYRKSGYTNVSDILIPNNKFKEYEFTVHLDSNDLI